jgi:acyl-homoserine-lactone acylase
MQAQLVRESGDGGSVEIRRTTHGVAHIRAESWRALGHGQGWACAVDHLPTIADQIIKVRSERARFHGPGRAERNLASDLGYLSLGVAEHAAALRDAQPDWIRDLVAGYVSGYNLRVGEVHGQGILPDWCSDAAWIRPISELDLYAYLGDVALMGSGRNLALLIGWARPPGADGPHPPAPMDALGGPAPGSNGWALGGDVTASGGGMVFANPHFPWGGEARFWECHLTIPGQIDVYGVSLLGTPGIQIGFNHDVAWAHTFSKGHRFTVYRQALVEGVPTEYRFGDGTRDMTSRDFTVPVLTGDGSLEEVQRTLWSTHHGPMLNMPLLGWGEEMAFSYRDANRDNTVVLEQFLRMGMAKDLDSFREVFHRVRGMPWVNTLAADRAGRAWYADHSATPALSPEAEQRFRDRLESDFVASLMHQNRIAMLDGSEPDDDWVVHDTARSPGLEPPERLPELEVRDVVVNANDSHWAPHPVQRLEGFSVLCGLERTPRSLRTRQNLRLAGELAARGDVTIDDVLSALFDNASLSADLLLDEVVRRCREAGEVHIGDQPRPLDDVVTILSAWDRRADTNSIGAVLWREIMCGFPDSDWADAGSLFEVGFDPGDPVGTPHSLAPAPDGGTDPVVAAVAHALSALEHAGVAPDARLGEVQWALRGGRRIPVHGGGEAEGMLNVLAPVGALPSSTTEPPVAVTVTLPGRERTGLHEGGYRISYGTSFLMVVEMTADGPRGTGLLAYGQSGDPASPHHADGTEAFANRTPRPLRFSEEEITADPVLSVVVLSLDGA